MNVAHKDHKRWAARVEKRDRDRLVASVNAMMESSGGRYLLGHILARFDEEGLALPRTDNSIFRSVAFREAADAIRAILAQADPKHWLRIQQERLELAKQDEAAMEAAQKRGKPPIDEESAGDNDDAE